ncbi:MAG: hypothetical protein DRH76_08990 [Deltaproteobacteria bacterium]|nr:MAG: hypothetical protein DRH76_08990 [Deltaproteobacteria bacterium]
MPASEAPNETAFCTTSCDSSRCPREEGCIRWRHGRRHFLKSGCSIFTPWGMRFEFRQMQVA